MAATDTTAGASTSKEDVLALVRENDIKFVRLWFTDILGQLKSFAVGVDELEGALNDGMGFDGSSITGFNRIEESDMIAMPDPNTFAVLPWRPKEKAVARMFCDVLVPGGEPYEGDPRYVMRRALERARAMGFDEFFLGPELEFFYFKQSELNGGPPEVLDKGGYFDLTTLDAASDLRRETVLALGELGIDVEYSHHEVGPSQHEIDMRFADGLRMADNAMTYRITVKEIAMKYGMYATFMPKPLFGENGSGMHVHQSLFRGGRNAFFDADDEYHLSAEAKSFIAGQLQARPRDLGPVRPVGELLQAPGAGIRGAGLHRVVAAEPLRARARADVPPGQGAGDALRAPLPRSRLQPVPDVRGVAARRARGHREGL